MPPELPIGPDDYLHMRSLKYGGGMGGSEHRRDGRGPAYFSGQDRRFPRARQERKDKGSVARGPAVLCRLAPGLPQSHGWERLGERYKDAERATGKTRKTQTTTATRTTPT